MTGADDRDRSVWDAATAALQREREERTASEADQTLSDLDQSQSDSDQQAGETDQLASDLDQELSDRDQHASDRDQVAADWQRSREPQSPAAGQAHDLSRLERDTGTGERSRATMARSKIASRRAATTARREELARLRDVTAAERDRTAQARDDAADARDRAAEGRERRATDAGQAPAFSAAMRELREANAALRHESALERLRAAADREAAAEDRRHAARERRLSRTDELTGVYRRRAGEAALTQELERARRSERELALALLDIDGLRAVNDAEGYAGGDALLRHVAAAISATVRAYDVIVRWGGDEFVFAMPETTAPVALERVAAIQLALTARRAGASISAGNAQLRAGDTLDSLVARAVAALSEAKQARRSE